MEQLKSRLSNRYVIALLSFALGLGSYWGVQKFMLRHQQQPVAVVNEPEDIFGRDFFGADDPFERMHRMQSQMMKQFAAPVAMTETATTDIKTREDDKYIYYDIEVPHLKEKNVKVRVDDGQVTISGMTEKKSDSDDQHSLFSSSFQRSFPAPVHGDPTKVKIEYDKDKVTLKFPKVEEEVTT